MRGNREWTESEDEFLRREYPSRRTCVGEIAAALGRTRAAVRFRASRLGLHRDEVRWTDAEDAELRAAHAAGESAPDTARRLGRTADGVRTRRKKLGLSRGKGGADA